MFPGQTVFPIHRECGAGHGIAEFLGTKYFVLLGYFPIQNVT